MIAKTYSVVLQGITPIKIEIEVNGHQGVPGFILIGLPAKAVDEAKERITSSLHHAHIRIRGKRTIVNLAPADLRKTSAALDFSIAVSLLAMYGEIKQPGDSMVFLGELSLDGTLKPLPNAVAHLIGAAKLGFKQAVYPANTNLHHQPSTGMELYPIKNLTEYIAWNRGLVMISPQIYQSTPRVVPDSHFDSILGQLTAKRALTISAAGHHHLLMTGPPGVGKTLLAQELVNLLPPLQESELLEVMAIHSLISHKADQIIQRPFRSPHHTSTVTGLLGGTIHLCPGEVSLAHHGVLCLDELPEFKTAALEALRQPLEQGSVTLSNASGTAHLPASVLLVATANPCPCGYFGSSTKTCRCSYPAIARYQQKLSGPLMDRIDLHVSLVTEKHHQKINQPSPNFLSLTQQIQQARNRQTDRYSRLGYQLVTEIPSSELEKFLTISQSAKKLVTKAAEALGLSMRSYFKMVRVSQTIADLAGAAVIEEEHMAEALHYRQPLFLK